MSDKKGLLPKLTIEVMGLVALSLDRDVDNTYVAEVIDRMEQDNPLLVAMIANYTGNMKEQVKGAYLAVLVYRLLEAQAEADYADELGSSKTN